MEEVATCACGNKEFEVRWCRLKCGRCGKEYRYDDETMAVHLMDMVNIGGRVTQEPPAGGVP